MTLDFFRTLTGRISCLILQRFIGRTSFDQWPTTCKKIIDDSPISLQRVLPIHSPIDPKGKPQEVFQFLPTIHAHILHSKLMFYSLTDQALSQFIHLLFDFVHRLLAKCCDAEGEAVWDVLEEQIQMVFGLGCPLETD